MKAALQLSEPGKTDNSEGVVEELDRSQRTPGEEQRNQVRNKQKTQTNRKRNKQTNTQHKQKETRLNKPNDKPSLNEHPL